MAYRAADSLGLNYEEEHLRHLSTGGTALAQREDAHLLPDAPDFDLCAAGDDVFFEDLVNHAGSLVF